ncbi:MAG: N-acetylglucosamine-6-sulfatase [Thermoleophilaceae bacterium]|nr:N-acetylglucosamine-6-sulfatase [Thermoleophilaceae bacterium]
MALAALALAAPALARPNIVVVMTDDQTAASLSTMQHVDGLLASEGTKFDRMIDSFPLCCPSRATFLTGQYAHNHGVLHNSGPFGGFLALDHTNTLPVWLHAAGYRTIHIGRYLNGYEYRNGIPAGWTDWHAYPHSSAFNYVSWKVNDNGVLNSYPDAAHPGEHQTDFTTRRATELIDAASPGEQPFFMSLWYVAPHRGAPRDADDPPRPGTPSPAPRHRDAFAGVRMPRHPNFNERNMYDKPQVVADRPRLSPELAAGVEENWRQENEALMGVDEGVAQIVEALRRNGELENTLIVYMSDNGFMHGEHRALAEKVLPYEESIRVPLVMRGPGIPRGRVDQRLVGNLDVPATILDAADAVSGRVLDGRSLLELLADPGAEWGRDILIENGNGANGVPAYRGMRTYRFKYIEHRTTGEYELYDLEKDPYELQSLDGRASYARVQADLRSRLRQLVSCAGVDCLARPHLTLSVRSDGRRVRGCFRKDLRIEVHGSKRARLVHADVMIGRRRVERLLNIPAARGRRGGPVTLSGRVRHQQIHRRGRFRLRVLAETEDGRKLTLDRVLRRCG